MKHLCLSVWLFPSVACRSVFCSVCLPVAQLPLSVSVCFSVCLPVALSDRSLPPSLSVCLSGSCLFSTKQKQTKNKTNKNKNWRHIHIHITDFLERHHPFRSFHYGFWCGHACQTALIRLTDTWLSAFSNHQMSGAAVLDFRKAFDLVYHDILLKELSSYKLSMASITFLRSYRVVYNAYL